MSPGLEVETTCYPMAIIWMDLLDIGIEDCHHTCTNAT